MKKIISTLLIFFNLTLTPEFYGSANQKKSLENTVPSKIVVTTKDKKELNNEESVKDSKVVGNKNDIAKAKESNKKEISTIKISLSNRKDKSGLKSEEKIPTGLDSKKIDPQKIQDVNKSFQEGGNFSTIKDKKTSNNERDSKHEETKNEMKKNKSEITIVKSNVAVKDGLNTENKYKKSDLKTKENKSKVETGEDNIELGKSGKKIKNSLNVNDKNKKPDLESKENNLREVNYDQIVDKYFKKTNGSFQKQGDSPVRKAFFTAAKYLLITVPIYLTLLYLIGSSGRSDGVRHSEYMKKFENMNQNNMLSECKDLVKVNVTNFEKNLKTIKSEQVIKNSDRDSNKTMEVRKTEPLNKTEELSRSVFSCQCNTNPIEGKEALEKNKAESVDPGRQKSTWYGFSLNCAKKVLSIAADKMLNLVPFYLLMRLY